MLCYKKNRVASLVCKATQNRNEGKYRQLCAVKLCVQVVGLFLCQAKGKVGILVSALLYRRHPEVDGKDELLIHHSLSVVWLHKFFSYFELQSDLLVLLASYFLQNLK